MTTVETARLLLRPWRADDLDEVARLWSDPVVARYTWRQPPTRDRIEVAAERILEAWQTHGFGPWAVLDKHSGSWIGKLGLELLDDWPDEHKIEVGWALHQAWWGQGLATEGAIASLHYAFEARRLEQVISVTVPANAASRRVMDRAGLVYQGTRAWRNAEVVWYAIDRLTWQASHPSAASQIIIKDTTSRTTVHLSSRNSAPTTTRRLGEPTARRDRRAPPG